MTAVADLQVSFDAEGFMTDPNEWSEDIAVVLAKEEGIDELTDRHWVVINFVRDEFGQHRPAADPAHDYEELRRSHQGSLRALPQGPGQEGGADRRPRQAKGLHLGPHRSGFPAACAGSPNPT